GARIPRTGRRDRETPRGLARAALRFGRPARVKPAPRRPDYPRTGRSEDEGEESSGDRAAATSPPSVSPDEPEDDPQSQQRRQVEDRREQKPARGRCRPLMDEPQAEIEEREVEQNGRGPEGDGHQDEGQERQHGLQRHEAILWLAAREDEVSRSLVI